MSLLLEARRNLRRKVNEEKRLDRIIHIFITTMLITNVILIVYAMLSITLRMTLSGVGVVDTLPLALYIIPLLILLPLMLRSYYRERTAAGNFVFLVITSAIFGLLSTFVRGFLVFLVLNAIAIGCIFVLGRFRPKGSIRKIGRKGIAYFILLNILGLMFPASIVIMGQYPIAYLHPTTIPQVGLTVPLAEFDYPYQNVTPTSQLLTDFAYYNISLDFKVLENNPLSWSDLRNWIVAINDTEIEYTVTLVADRGSLAGNDPTTLATADLIEDVYISHMNAINKLVNESLINITNTPHTVLFDMTLSRQEWKALMIQTRNVNLLGFGELLRTSLDATPVDQIQTWETSLHLQAEASGLETGLVIESFVVDDLQDGDTGVMRFCGVTVDSVSLWDYFVVSCERSRFSFEMNGDVGEYLIHSIASTVGKLGNEWGLRIGEIGNATDIDGRQTDVYENLHVLATDMSLAASHGVDMLIIGSLPSLLSSTLIHIDNALWDLRILIDWTPTASVTYTFRIYAFRAVFMAIDTFDLIML